ncbi:unnamed protein product, partial [Ectocarpus sp. 13 AM-2016]
GPLRYVAWLVCMLRRGRLAHGLLLDMASGLLLILLILLPVLANLRVCTREIHNISLQKRSDKSTPCLESVEQTRNTRSLLMHHVLRWSRDTLQFCMCGHS